MEDWLNKVTYGNLSKYHLDILKRKCLADDVIPILDKTYGSQLDFPLNNSESVKQEFTVKGMDVAEIYNSINEDIAPTIIKLKQKYQRPRPFQLAQYYKLKLFPYDTFSGHSPSYPSGHTIQAYVILNIIGNKYPQSYGFCKQFITDIADSRVYLGLHYPSDNDASYLIGQEILKLKSITDKYKI